MTNDKEKDDIKHRFVNFLERHSTAFPDPQEIDDVFDFFYQEIEVYKNLFKQAGEKNKELDAKISQLEAIVVAADELVSEEAKLFKLISEGTVPLSVAEEVNAQSEVCQKALEKYNQLKQNS